ncbi:hypothetical protein DFH09DRAFT_1089977 [Mycena vulgaris]|nr:hypothetical protein DFH09DRAFT_1333585 [Mycena vulgaris]KAJ6539972.1 hypothetical protein DFH09DRAFT_1089977 [Mycena vulgaris]
MPASYALIWITPALSIAATTAPILTAHNDATIVPPSLGIKQASAPVVAALAPYRHCCRRPRRIRPPSPCRHHPQARCISSPRCSPGSHHRYCPDGRSWSQAATRNSAAEVRLRPAYWDQDITRQAGAIRKVVLPDYDLSGVFERIPVPGHCLCLETEIQAAWFVTAFNASRVQPYKNLWASLN